MRLAQFASAITAAATLSACATTPMPAATALATGALTRADGNSVGQVTITPMADHLALRITVSGFAPGAYGTHLHAVGRCEGPAFASAGGHLNPTGAQHGRLNPAGSHLGDLPNLIVGNDGAGTLEAMVMASADSLFDADGTALVVHAAADDERTDPSGNSGARVACAVLNRAG